MTPHKALLLGLSLALTASGCSSPDGPLPSFELAAPGAYRLGPGDELRISVLGLDAITNNYLVDDTGAVALPMLDPIPVAGLTLRETERIIGQSIVSRNLVIDPRVSAQMKVYRPFFIAGEVQRPGQYPYVPGMSLMVAVSIAGGYTFRADTDKAVITRATKKGIATQGTLVLPGDTIVVRESWF